MKLVASLIATAALALGGLAAIPPAATAAPPYPGTVATATDYAVPRSIKKNRSLTVAYRVRAAGNARPSGIVKLRVWKYQNGAWRFNRGVNVNYTAPTGKRFTFRSLGKFKTKGYYTTRAYFVPRNSNSVYKASASGYRTFRVVKR